MRENKKRNWRNIMTHFANNVGLEDVVIIALCPIE
jgi:hypothetical protein